MEDPGDWTSLFASTGTSERSLPPPVISKERIAFPVSASRSSPIPRSGHSFSDQVERALRDDILRGLYRPGERLNEVEISHELEVSRGPVREAMQRLARDGLVELRPHRGAFVRQLLPDEVRDLFEVRVALETRVARLAAERASADGHQHLRSVLTPSTTTRNGDQRFQGDRDLHAVLAEISENRALAAHVASVNQELRLVRIQSRDAPGRADGATTEHTAIIEAVLAGDVAAAVTAMETHLRHALEHALRTLEHQAATLGEAATRSD
jgi:DNA-binding GntR family transcriptional regulator